MRIVKADRKGGVKMSKLQHAANCALWLLSQPELKEVIDSDWGDPIAIKQTLEEAGCIPSCELLPERETKARIVKADTIDKAKKIIFDEENVRANVVMQDTYGCDIYHFYYVELLPNMIEKYTKILASYNTETKEMVIY